MATQTSRQGVRGARVHEHGQEYTSSMAATRFAWPGDGSSATGTAGAKKGMMMVAVAAMDMQGGIGNKGALPWDMPLERRMFRQLTTSTRDPLKINAIVMGRKTWESIGCMRLPHRLTAVISKSANTAVQARAAQCLSFASLEEAYYVLTSAPDVERIFVVGGSGLYAEAIASQKCDELYITHVRNVFETDTKFPPFETEYVAVSSSRPITDITSGLEFVVYIYRRIISSPAPASVQVPAPQPTVCRQVGPGSDAPSYDGVGGSSSLPGGLDTSLRLLESSPAAQFAVTACGQPEGGQLGMFGTTTPPIRSSICPLGLVTPVNRETTRADVHPIVGVKLERDTVLSNRIYYGAGPIEHPEMQYLSLVERAMRDGIVRSSRSGNTRSVFGAMMRFDLANTGFPLLTTKKMFWRGIAEELFWFLAGDTSAKTLQAKNVHIWDANATPEFMAKACPKCKYAEGDLGPIYGFQWRHFGAEYAGSAASYAGKGVDQLVAVVNAIKTNPESRRIIMCAWNPVDIDKMALPPCHVLSQFFVANGRVSCLLYQRSGDLGLGVPFNIASYSLLTHLIAHACSLRVGDFVHVIGDAHVYENHIAGLCEQISRTPKPFPSLVIRPAPGSVPIDAFSIADIAVENYSSCDAIPLTMNP